MPARLHSQAVDPSMFATQDSTIMRGTYYSDYFVGRKTSNGEIFRQNQFTAAHKTIPLGTYLYVTNTETGLSVVVVVNDRCPRRGILDMTKIAIYTLGIRGSHTVVVRTLTPKAGYQLWVQQDTLSMSDNDYAQFKDRYHRHNQPHPTSRTAVSARKTQKNNNPIDTTASIHQETPIPIIETEAAQTEISADSASLSANGERLYDIKLTTTATRNAAKLKIGRLPQELQAKTAIYHDADNHCYHIIIQLSETRSHAIRTQAALLDDYPECTIVPQKKLQSGHSQRHK